MFDLDNLHECLDLLGQGIFAPRDSLNRALASFVYINKPSVLYEVFKFFLPPFNASNEMEALGLMAQNSRHFFSLPTESFSISRDMWNQISPQYTRGIFDAAAIGQYLLGIDPRNCPLQVKRNGFKNENCLIDWSKYNFIADYDSLSMLDLATLSTYKCYNLHVHSKRFKLATNILRGNHRLVERLNNGRAIIIGSRIMVIMGGPMRFLMKLLRFGIRYLDRLTFFMSKNC
ncbi:hypothetical protein KBZ13_05000 [Cyanobium sp. ATX 6F1]|nr:hypothetical protein [Cyanobium sp. ATX 6F1]